MNEGHIKSLTQLLRPVLHQYTEAELQHYVEAIHEEVQQWLVREAPPDKHSAYLKALRAQLLEAPTAIASVSASVPVQQQQEEEEDVGELDHEPTTTADNAAAAAATLTELSESLMSIESSLLLCRLLENDAEGVESSDVMLLCDIVQSLCLSSIPAQKKNI